MDLDGSSIDPSNTHTTLTAYTLHVYIQYMTVNTMELCIHTHNSVYTQIHTHNAHSLHTTCLHTDIRYMTVNTMELCIKQTSLYTHNMPGWFIRKCLYLSRYTHRLYLCILYIYTHNTHKLHVIYLMHIHTCYGHFSCACDR